MGGGGGGFDSGDGNFKKGAIRPIAVLIGAPGWVLGAVAAAIVSRLAGQMLVRRELTGDAIGPAVLLDTVLGEAVVGWIFTDP